MRINRQSSSGIAFGVLALVAIGCSSKAGTGGGNSNTKDKGDAGGPPPATWTNQAYDVQSTWHDTNEPKLTKDNVGSLVELSSSPVRIESPVTVVRNIDYTAASSGIASFNPYTDCFI